MATEPEELEKEATEEGKFEARLENDTFRERRDSFSPRGYYRVIKR